MAKISCDLCRGEGKVQLDKDKHPKDCPQCGGRGWLWALTEGRGRRWAR